VLRSNLQNALDRIFQKLLEAHEEADGVLAVREAMVVGQGHVHHGTDFHLALDCHGAFSPSAKGIGMRHERYARRRRDPDRRKAGLVFGSALGRCPTRACQRFALALQVLFKIWNSRRASAYASAVYDSGHDRAFIYC